MARTKQNQRSASRGSVPLGTTGGRTPPSRLTVGLLTASVLSAVWTAAMLTPGGRTAYVYVFAYSEFYMGVLTLVALSITIMIGLVATDRMMLSVRQRVLLQSAHRATGIIAVGALGVHIATKVAVGRVDAIDAVVPFMARNQTAYVGLGTLAAYCLVSVLWTGIARARFAGRGKPWMWRSLHSVAYLCWPIALVHGLNAGRPAANWVIVSYVACVLLVLVALVVRLSISLGRRKDFASSTSTGNMKPVGQLVPTASASATGRSRRRPDRTAEVVVEPVATRVVADRHNAPEPVRSWAATGTDERSPRRRPAEEEYRPARPRRAAEDEYGPVRAAEDEYRPVRAAEEEYRPARPRRAAEDGYRPVRAAQDEYRPGRAADEDYRLDEADRPDEADRSDEAYRPAARRARRYAEEERADPRRSYADSAQRQRISDPGDVPRQRAERYAADDDYRESDRFDSDRLDRDRLDSDRFDSDRFDTGRYRGDRYAAERVEADRGDAPVRSRSRRPSAEEPARSRWRAEVPQPRASRYVDDEAEPVQPRARRYADQEAYDLPQPRRRRYAEDEPVVPSRRRDRSDNSGAGYGRHSRNDGFESADPWQVTGDDDRTPLPPDDTPTLVDMAARRAMRADRSRSTGRSARRRRAFEDATDESYLRQLRGEAQ